MSQKDVRNRFFEIFNFGRYFFSRSDHFIVSCDCECIVYAVGEEHAVIGGEWISLFADVAFDVHEVHSEGKLHKPYNSAYTTFNSSNAATIE